MFLTALLPRAALGGDPAQAAAAQQLYDDALKLEKAEKFADACPKFAESQRLDPAAGTLLHLGNCLEKTGKTASAWATFIDAAAAAKQQNRTDWEKIARTRAKDLEPKLSRLTILAPSPAPGMEVKRDGAVIAGASLGTALPIDPGEHKIEASAPGYQPWSSIVVIGPNADKKEVGVPALTAAPQTPPSASTAPPPPSATAPPPPPPQEEGGSGKTIGLVVAGVGVAGIAVGSVTGVLALGANNDAKKLCPNDGACASREGVDQNDKARTFATVSTIGFIAGGALLVGGGVLYVLSGSKKRGGVDVAPVVGANEGGVMMRGAW